MYSLLALRVTMTRWGVHPTYIIYTYILYILTDLYGTPTTETLNPNPFGGAQVWDSSGIPAVPTGSVC